MSDEGSKGSEWANLTPDCLFTIFTKLTLEEMLEGPLQVCKPWMETGNQSVFSVFDFGSRTVQLPTTGEFDWTAMEEKMDTLLRFFADKSGGCLKSIKIKLCTDQSVSYVAEKCPALEVLWLTSCPGVTDASMIKIATNCINLKELRIRTSRQITDRTLKLVKENCPNVVILDD